MLTKLLFQNSGLRTFAAILETGDEAMACLKAVAARHSLDGAAITAIGAFERATLLYFDWPAKKYLEIPVTEQVEVASLIGDIGIDEEGKPAVHVHLVLGRRNGSALAGHLREGHVRPTLEMIITETAPDLVRRHDPASGLNLIRF